MRPDLSSHHLRHRNMAGDGGFSLLEMLIVIGVMSIVLSVAVGGFDNISRFFTPGKREVGHPKEGPFRTRSDDSRTSSWQA